MRALARPRLRLVRAFSLVALADERLREERVALRDPLQRGAGRGAIAQRAASSGRPPPAMSSARRLASSSQSASPPQRSGSALESASQRGRRSAMDGHALGSPVWMATPIGPQTSSPSCGRHSSSMPAAITSRHSGASSRAAWKNVCRATQFGCSSSSSNAQIEGSSNATARQSKSSRAANAREAGASGADPQSCSAATRWQASPSAASRASQWAKLPADDATDDVSDDVSGDESDAVSEHPSEVADRRASTAKRRGKTGRLLRLGTVRPADASWRPRGRSARKCILSPHLASGTSGSVTGG